MENTFCVRRKAVDKAVLSEDPSAVLVAPPPMGYVHVLPNGSTEASARVNFENTSIVRGEAVDTLV